MDDRIAAGLRAHGLDAYVDLFRQQRIDLDVLAELDDGVLAGFGVPWADRRRLLKAITDIGADIGDGTGAAAGAAGAAEQRPVTVLFADLTDFSGLSARLGGERTRDLLNDYFRAVFDIVARFGGTVQDPDGDCAVAFFGAPVAHTDDPARAVRAACAIHEAVGALAGGWGLELSAHIGVASGLVVAGETGSDRRRVFTVIGESVNLAKRLESGAAPGETLVSEPVWRAVRGLARCTARAPLAVKGFEAPVPAWSVAGIARAEAPEGQAPFVGRGAELGQIEALLAGCAEAGTGCMALIRGEPGIGKSRIAREAAARAAGLGFAIARGLVLDFGVARGDEAIPSVLRDILAVAAPGTQAPAGVPAELQVFLNDILALPQPGALRSLYDAMEADTREAGAGRLIDHALSAAVAVAPLMVVIEDIHWADETTLARLAQLAGGIAERPVVLLLTTRPEGPTMAPGWHGKITGCPVTTIELQALPGRDAEALARALGASDNVELGPLVARAGGNPLFLEQLVQAAQRQPGRLPDTVHAIVAATTDRLPRADREALRAASVLGQRFAPEAVRALVGDADYRFERLHAERLVRPEGGSLLFAHALFREAIYATLLTPDRTRLHAAAAAWFAPRDAALYARHLDLAGDPAAPAAYLTAAGEAERQYRLGQALELAERGAALASERGTLHRLQVARGALLGALERRAEAADAYQQAQATAETAAERCAALIGEAVSLLRLDRHEAAERLLEEAAACAAAGGLAGATAQMHRHRASIAFARGDAHASRAHSQAALEAAAGAGLTALEAEALSCKGDAEVALGRFVSATESFSRCVALCRELGLRRYGLINLKMLGDTEFYRGELAGSVETMQRVIAEAQEIGAPRAEMLAHGMLAYRDILAARPAEALPRLARARELIHEIGATRFLMNNACYAAMAERALGNRDRALEHLAQAEATARELNVTWLMPWVLGERALALSDTTARLCCLDDAEELLRSGAGDYARTEFYRPAIEVGIETGDWDRVERYADELEAFMGDEPAGLGRVIAARGRALAQAGRGRPDRAALQALRDETEAMQFREAVPRLDAALAAAGG